MNRLRAALLRRIRFALFKRRLRRGLRAHGGRLVVRAPHGPPDLATVPRVSVLPGGGGEGVTTLEFGMGAWIGRELALELHAGGSNRLRLGDSAYLMDRVRVILRNGTLDMAAHAHVRDGGIVKVSDGGTIAVGEQVTLSWYATLACTTRIEIGDLCGFGERVTLIDSDHPHEGTDEHWLYLPLRPRPISVGRNTLVGAGAVLLAGAQIGANALVGAGAVVAAGEQPAGWLIAGNPARPVRELSSQHAGASSAGVPRLD